MPSQMESAKVRETPPKPSVCRIFRGMVLFFFFNHVPYVCVRLCTHNTWYYDMHAPNLICCLVGILGRKSSMNTPTKLTTAVAYPFSLVKPCEDQGGVTLKDINQRLHAPPLSKSKQGKEEAPYPTSAFSGKPVVVKTKIITEGGRGSITITRTKGWIWNLVLVLMHFNFWWVCMISWGHIVRNFAILFRRILVLYWNL